jgi:hypothetical protein
MCVSSFSTTFVWNIFLSKKNWARYDWKCMLVFMWSTLYPCPILMKLECSSQNFEIYSYVKFSDNPSNERRVVPCGRKDRWDMTKLIVAFRSFEEAPKKFLSPHLRGVHNEIYENGQIMHVILTFYCRHGECKHACFRKNVCLASETLNVCGIACVQFSFETHYSASTTLQHMGSE